jgi:hypothetical protein
VIILTQNSLSKNEEKIKKAIGTLLPLVDNTAIPRNIRMTVKEVINGLNDHSLGPGVRAANARSVLEEISQDPNVPSYARVTLWNAISILESVRE